MGVPTPLDYAAWRARTLGRITERLERDVILDLAGPVAGRDVLDVGCGDGIYVAALATRGERVTGLDVSLPALRAAGSSAADAGVRVALVSGDAARLPFRAGTFDLVVAVTTLCFVAAPEQAVAEIARLLRPGGRVLIGELGRWSSWVAWRRLRSWVGRGAWGGTRFWTAAALRRLARGAGLAPGRIRGAVFYPPVAGAAAAFAPLDPLLGRWTTAGAAFVAMEAEKPRRGPETHSSAPRDSNTQKSH